MAFVSSKKNRTLLVIAGPTAVGKTGLAIQLAEKLNAPILSFDSRQFYREMNLGTAKPLPEELAKAPHFFIDNLSIHDHYTSGKFELEALSKLEELFQHYPLVIAVGGSGLYIHALCYGIDEIPTNEKIREQLIQRWQTEGLEILQNEVRLVDPEFYEASDMKNPRRVIRALEVYHTSGLTYSVFRKNKAKDRNFNTYWVGLELERENLFERINKRVDQMISNGLVTEVESLLPYKNLKTLKTVGYQELFDYFEGRITLDQAIDLIKRNTRIFAKKQMVWFKRNPEITWFQPHQAEEILERISDNFIK